MSPLNIIFLSLMASSLYGVQKGDFDRDGSVDFSDLLILAQYWLSPDNPDCAGDTTGDCLANLTDFSDVSQNWLTLTCSDFSATASSEENPSLAALNAVDGTLATRWSSAFADDQWLQLDLGQIRKVTGLQKERVGPAIQILEER